MNSIIQQLSAHNFVSFKHKEVEIFVRKCLTECKYFVHTKLSSQTEGKWKEFATIQDVEAFLKTL